MLPAFLMSDEQKRFMGKVRSYQTNEMLSKKQPWDPEMKWEKRLGIEAESYMAWVREQMLFPDLPSGIPSKRPDGTKVLVPGTKLAYVHSAVPEGGILATYYGKNVGKICFDGEVIVPGLIQLDKDPESYLGNVWMSLTPSEVFSLRGGTRLAKGHTVIAGLGLGYQLVQVAKRKKVERITLVERDGKLVDWLMPMLEARLGGRKIEVIVGDARKEVPKLEADVALIDIDMGYGGNEFEPRCPRIPKIWVWGSSEPNTDGSIFG